MREIMFRVWDPNSEQMYSNIGIDKIHLYEFKGNNITEQGGLEIMQYTGLKDKNGKDIYEGDIVTGESFITSMQHLWGDKDIKSKSEMHVIKYHEASFKLFNSKGNWVAVLNHHVMSKSEKLVVIGNIYENPELIP